MRENVTPTQMKWGISVIMTIVYAFGAAYFYYLPAKGEPNIGVNFWWLLFHFLVLGFIFWMVLIPGQKAGKPAGLLTLTILTIPAGLVISLLFTFAVAGVGITGTLGLGYLVLSIVPFTLAYKAVVDRVDVTPVLLALAYWIVVYLWRKAIW